MAHFTLQGDHVHSSITIDKCCHHGTENVKFSPLPGRINVTAGDVLVASSLDDATKYLHFGGGEDTEFDAFFPEMKDDEWDCVPFIVSSSPSSSSADACTRWKESEGRDHS